MPEKIIFSPVSLCTYNDNLAKPWFVYFDVTNTSLGITIRKQFRGGINFFSDLKDRKRAGEQLKKYWEERLKNGWSPFERTKDSGPTPLRFNEALDWSLKNCRTSSKTKRDYAGTVRFFKDAASKIGLNNALISGIEKKHILMLLDQIRKERNWSNHAYNKNAGYISGVLSRLIDYEIITHNPASKIKKLPEVESDMYETITEEEKILIKNYLTVVHPAFFTYLMLIYHTGIRPKECLALRISDVNLLKKYIKIKPDFVKENSKTKSIRIVPLNDHIFQLLSAHLEDCHDGEFFVFGSPNAPVGMRGQMKSSKSGSVQTDYFLPSEYHMKRDTATKCWKRLIWNGLGIHKYQYALKHTGADDKILAGIPLDALRSLYGHSSILMTEKYARKVKEIYRDQIVNNSPDF